MAIEHWRYYLSIEEDFLHTGRYVEITPDNSQVNSIEYTRLLLALGSEVDVLCKLLCEQIDPASDAVNINQYHAIIAARYPKIMDYPITPVQWNRTWIPWHGWEKDKPPKWWSDHNKVKHRRHEHYARANQENTLEALIGLLVVNLFYYRANGEMWELPPSKLIPLMFISYGRTPTYFPDSLFE